MSSIIRANIWQNSSGVARQTILQVVSTNKSNSFVGTSVNTGVGHFIDVPGMAATITPSSTTSRILVMMSMYVGVTTASSGYQLNSRIRRNGAYPIIGDAEGSRPRVSARINMYQLNTYSMQMMTGSWVDSPASTAALTYQVELGGYSASPIVYVNRSETQQNTTDYDGVPVSTITLMEIAG
jgi:hypothetical protein